jgi:hypothetical protein
MKTASRILMTISLLVFFTGMTFAQVASTTSPGKPAKKAEVAAPAKSADGTKANCGHGKNFVDNNSDGKCDNCGTAGKCKEAGSGCGKGQGCGSSCGKGQGNGNCKGNGAGNRNGCASKCSNAPAAQPKK